MGAVEIPVFGKIVIAVISRDKSCAISPLQRIAHLQTLTIQAFSGEGENEYAVRSFDHAIGLPMGKIYRYGG